MNTPICDFVRAYGQADGLRLHMPGHKGRGLLGVEKLDITEIAGADELYHARGIIARSEENASSLFGTARTLYSAEGSSLCIRAMLYLALMQGRAEGKRPLLLAGRNAHKTLMSAAALMDFEIEWLYPDDAGPLHSCRIDAEGLEGALLSMKTLPVAVYLTTPDYLGHLADVASLARVCHRHGVLLLVDNAHGAYLRFLPEDRHPISLGADLCCDSAHKTLPVLTGGAYLHLSRHAPGALLEQAERAMALFASTSPSYLILQSLDAANPYLAQGFREDLAAMLGQLQGIRARLSEHGYPLVGNEPGKLTIAPKAFGYTGDELHACLRTRGLECEFSDPDYLVMMPSPVQRPEEMARMADMLLDIPRREALSLLPPPLPRPQRACSIRRAALALQKEIPAEAALGKILADAHVGCPPCIPILACGERIDEAALRCFRYYGVEKCTVVAEE